MIATNKLRTFAHVALLFLVACACTAAAAATTPTAASSGAFITETGISAAPAVAVRSATSRAWQQLESAPRGTGAGSARGLAGRLKMRTLSDAGGELAQGDVMSRGPTTGTTLSIGYWLQATAGANFSVYLIKAADYSKVLSLADFSYYAAYSAKNVASAYLPTTHMTDIAEPLQVVIFGMDYEATTIKGIISMQEAECVAAEPCQNQGLCTGAGLCECPANGWTGATCSTPVCSAVTCNERQECTGPNTCSCKAGWSGPNCATPICAQGCTTGQGTCTAPNTCTCLTGFVGSACLGVNGGYSNYTSVNSACISTGGSEGDSCAITETRTCTSPPPSNGGAGCGVLGPAIRQVSCTCPPVNGGYSDWGEFGVCSGQPACTQSRSRSCTNPAPSNGGADCTALGPAIEAQVCDSCGSGGAPLLSAAVITTDAAQMSELAASRGWQTKAEWDAANPDGTDYLVPFVVFLCLFVVAVLGAVLVFLRMRRQLRQVHAQARGGPGVTLTTSTPTASPPSQKAALHVHVNVAKQSPQQAAIAKASPKATQYAYAPHSTK